MASSLDALAKTLQDSDLKLLRHRFQHFNDNEFKKIRAKGIFPHSFLDSKEKFQAALPEYGEEWRNTLTGKSDVTPEIRKQLKCISCWNAAFSGITTTFIYK